MSYLLQYNKEYDKAMKSLGMTFKTAKKPGLFQKSSTYRENQSPALKRKQTIFRITSNSKAIERGLQNAMKNEAQAPDKNVNLDFEMGNQQIFKKNIALKKVLSKFLNKTYQATIDSQSMDHTVKIKIQISKIYLFLVDLREEFLISNAFAYFKQYYYPKLKFFQKDPESEEYLKSYDLINKT